MKAILSMALVVGLCGLAGAQGEKADPVGTWKCEYKIGDQKRMCTMMIEKDGDKLAGTMSWPDQKAEKLKDVKLKASTLTFSAVRKFMGNEFPLDFTLTIDGDKFKGKAASDFGGKKQEFDIEGKREKKGKERLGGSARGRCHADPNAPPDRGRITVFRGSTALPWPRQVNFGVPSAVFGGVAVR